MKKFTTLFSILLLLVLHDATGQPLFIKIFYPGSYAKLLESNKGEEFILLFWSIDCAPCLKKLKQISEKKIDVKQKFIFVSTDGDDMLVDVAAVIKQLNLEQQAHWIFKSELTPEIINSVDGRWYGEVPRYYYFDTNHQRIRLQELKLKQ